MSERDLGKAMLRGEGPIDVEILTDRVLRRDRRRIWILGIFCVVAWMLVVMLPWAGILPMLAKVVKHQEDINNTTAAGTPAEQRERLTEVLRVVKSSTIMTFAFSVASMFAAALCTVLLITTSRRATLRQVNARLREISMQISSLPGQRKQ
jgi:ABC-type Fe3+ transport system permease subunit